MARKKSSNLPALPFDSERDNDYIADELPLSADLDTIYYVPNFNIERVLMFLRRNLACDPGLRAAQFSHDARSAWQAITNPSWLFWVMREIGGRHGFPEFEAFMLTTHSIWWRYQLAIIRAGSEVANPIRHFELCAAADRQALFELKSRIVFYD